MNDFVGETKKPKSTKYRGLISSTRSRDRASGETGTDAVNRKKRKVGDFTRRDSIIKIIIQYLIIKFFFKPRG